MAKFSELWRPTRQRTLFGRSLGLTNYQNRQTGEIVSYRQARTRYFGASPEVVTNASKSKQGAQLLKDYERANGDLQGVGNALVQLEEATKARSFEQRIAAISLFKHAPNESPDEWIYNVYGLRLDEPPDEYDEEQEYDE